MYVNMCLILNSIYRNIICTSFEALREFEINALIPQYIDYTKVCIDCSEMKENFWPLKQWPEILFHFRTVYNIVATYVTYYYICKSDSMKCDLEYHIDLIHEMKVF